MSSSSHAPDQVTKLGSGGSFSCSICSKGFLNRLSRNRHVLYCRQKQLKQDHTRRKSCTNCRRAKTRCNEVAPQCERCKNKKLECVYDGGRPKDSSLPLQGLEDDKPLRDVGTNLANSPTHQALIPSPSWQISRIGSQDFSSEGSTHQNRGASPVTTSYNPLIDLYHKEYSGTNLQLNSLILTHDYSLDPLLHQEIDFPWTPQYQDKDDYFAAADLLNHTAQGVQNFSSQLSSQDLSLGIMEISNQAETRISLQSPEELALGSSHLVTAGADSSLLSLGMEAISSTTDGKCLFKRRQRSGGSQLGCYYLLQTLKSFPRMMLCDTLPPFIHEACGGFDSGQTPSSSIQTQLPLREPLAICKNIMHLYFSKTKESTAFVWRTLEMELIRLEMEYVNLDDWTLIASLQALTIYIILATFEEDRISPSIDARLLHTMSAVAAKAEASNYLDRMPQYGEWQEWVLRESKHRTFTLLFIINMLFDINPHHNPETCNAIAVIPVPAHKSLWHAASHWDWKKAQTEFLKGRENRPSLTYSDIISLHQKNQINQTAQANTLADLEEWFLNVDAFGTFVLMTATSM